MTDRVRTVGGPERVERRESERRERERRAQKPVSRALVPGPVEASEAKPATGPARPAVHPAIDACAAAFVAQQIGQKGQKRGLRGGPPVLDAARSAYLGTEYSGWAERRPQRGKTAKTEI